MKKTIVLLYLMVLWTSVIIAQKPQRFHKALPAGNYSGITALGNNRYAVVSDKSETEGFFILHIETDSVKGCITSLENEGFQSSGLPNRDIEGICYRPQQILFSYLERRIMRYMNILWMENGPDNAWRCQTSSRRQDTTTDWNR